MLRELVEVMLNHCMSKEVATENNQAYLEVE